MKPTHLLPLFSLLLLPLFAPDREPPAALAPDRELASLVPAECPLYVEAPGLADLARQGLAHPLARALLGSEKVRAALSSADSKPEAWLAALDAQAGFPVLPTVAGLGARGAAFALTVRGGAPRFLVLARGESAQEVQSMLAELLGSAARKAGFPGAFDEPAENIRGADVWLIGEQFAVARRDALLLAANDEGLLRDALELAADAQGRGLLGSADFATASAARGKQDVAWAWADLAALEKLAEQTADKGEGLENLRAMAAQPSAQFLLGPGFAAAGRARTVALAARLQREDVELVLSADGVDAGAAAALLPQAGEGCPPPVASGADAADALVYRDLADLFAKRADLFPPEMLPGFAEAVGNFAFLFGGEDVGEKVWPELAPWMRLVARDVAFAPGAAPEIALPAAALLLRVKDRERMGPTLTSAFQTTIGFVNLDRAQKGKKPFTLQIEMQDGVQITYGKYLAPKAGEGVDIEYNLEPACALVGDTFVLGTHRGIVEELARSLAKAGSAPAPRDEHLRLSGAAVARALAQNREAMVMNAVLTEGKSREQAERDIDVAVGLAAAIERASFAVRYPAPQRIELALDLDLTAAKE